MVKNRGGENGMILPGGENGISQYNESYLMTNQLVVIAFDRI